MKFFAAALLATAVFGVKLYDESDDLSDALADTDFSCPKDMKKLRDMLKERLPKD